MARNDEGGNMVLSPRCIGLGAGKGGEMMKLIGAIFLFFILSACAQTLFDQAEIEFDVDYIDIDKVKMLGSDKKGHVLVVWLKNGNVLTKTLSNSKIKYDTDDNYSDTALYSVLHQNRLPISELENMSNVELVSRI